MIEDKVTLTRKRAELVEILTTELAPVERIRVQGELSVINALIKAQNTTAAAELKAAADRRKAVGLAEAQANAARARAKIGEAAPDENDPGQITAIDTWIIGVLADSGVKVRRVRGVLDFGCFGDIPAKWLVVIQRLCDGIHAAARGEELPEAYMPEPPKAKKRRERS